MLSIRDEVSNLLMISTWWSNSDDNTSRVQSNFNMSTLNVEFANISDCLSNCLCILLQLIDSCIMITKPLQKFISGGGWLKRLGNQGLNEE